MRRALRRSGRLAALRYKAVRPVTGWWAELPAIEARHWGGVLVIPILGRPCNLDEFPLRNLQYLPRNRDFLFETENTEEKIVSVIYDILGAIKHGDLMPRFSNGSSLNDWYAVHYININRIGVLTKIPVEIDSKIKFLNEAGFQIPSIIRKTLRTMYSVNEKIRIFHGSIREIERFKPGLLLAYSNSWRTRNIPTLDEMYGVSRSRKRRTDPHVYCAFNGYRVILSIDPANITTSTAFSDFGSSERQIWDAIFLVKDISEDTIYGTPLLIGIAEQDFHKELRCQ